jgi:hypothetical protein
LYCIGIVAFRFASLVIVSQLILSSKIVVSHTNTDVTVSLSVSPMTAAFYCIVDFGMYDPSLTSGLALFRFGFVSGNHRNAKRFIRAMNFGFDWHAFG